METFICKLNKNQVILFKIYDRNHTTIRSFSVLDTDSVSLKKYIDSVKIDRVEAIKLLQDFIKTHKIKNIARKTINGYSFDFNAMANNDRIYEANRLQDKLLKEIRREEAKKAKKITKSSCWMLYDNDSVILTSMDKIMDAYNDFIQSENF